MFKPPLNLGNALEYNVWVLVMCACGGEWYLMCLYHIYNTVIYYVYINAPFRGLTNAYTEVEPQKPHIIIVAYISVWYKF